MKLGGLLLALLLNMVSSGTPAKTIPQQDEAACREIEADLSQIARARMNGDVRAVRSYVEHKVSPEYVQVRPDGTIVRRDAVLKHMLDHLKGGRVSDDRRIERCVVHGKVAKVVDVGTERDKAFDYQGKMHILEKKYRSNYTWIRTKEGWKDQRLDPVVIKLKLDGRAIPIPKNGKIPGLK